MVMRVLFCLFVCLVRGVLGRGEEFVGVADFIVVGFGGQRTDVVTSLVSIREAVPSLHR